MKITSVKRRISPFNFEPELYAETDTGENIILKDSQYQDIYHVLGDEEQAYNEIKTAIINSGFSEEQSDELVSLLKKYFVDCLEKWEKDIVNE